MGERIILNFTIRMIMTSQRNKKNIGDVKGLPDIKTNRTETYKTCETI